MLCAMSTSTIVINDAKLKSLALVVARNRVGPNDPIEDILAREEVDQGVFAAILTDPVFRRYVRGFVHELTESGFSFSYKSKILAEELLPDLYHMVRNEDLPAAARAKIAENLVEWGGLKPQPAAVPVTPPGGGFHITFNIPALPQERAAITMDAAAAIPPAFSIGFTPVPVPTEEAMLCNVEDEEE